MALVVLAALAAAPAGAGPIRTAGTDRPLSEVRRLAAVQARSLARHRAPAPAVLSRGTAWDNYFARALARRSLRVQGPDAVRTLSAVPGGTLPDSALVDYLLWRRSLNPARFDRNHPGLGPLLTRPTVRPRVLPNPPNEPGTFNPPPPLPPPPPPQIPEPTSAAVALLALGAGLAGRSWARRRQARPVVYSTS